MTGSATSVGGRVGPGVVGVVGGAGLLGWGYTVPASLAFYGGLAVFTAGLVVLALAAARRGRGVPLAALNTAIAICVGLVVAEIGLRVADRDAAARPEPVYTFGEARADPAAFQLWAEAYLAEWERTRHFYLQQDPRGVNPMVPIPGARVDFFESRHRINALGFRGPEIDRDKGAHFRIVAIGESTTFGATIRRDDRPWPEVLEARIAAELDCERPVQVVNAGIPGWTLANNLARLDADIWPLSPDLVLSYHGYNGFPYLIAEIPSLQVGDAPRVPERPSLLLQRFERALRVALFRRRFAAARALDERSLETDVQISRYAELYRDLVTAARRHGVELVLATFNLAVTPESPEPVIEFYELMFPDVRARALANRLHTRLVRQIGASYGVTVVDTSEGLDGAYESAYIDPMHFTQAGREILAGGWLRGIEPLLAERAGCRRRDHAKRTPRGAEVGRPSGGAG